MKTTSKTGDNSVAAARLLRQLENFLGDGNLEEMIDRLKALEDTVGPIKRLDFKTMLAEHERMRAGQKRLEQMIRTSKKGGYFPGIEDAGENFSVLRAMVGKRAGRSKQDWESAGAGFEYEVMTESWKRLSEVYTKAGHAMGDDRTAGSFIPDQVIPDVIGGIYTRSVFVALEGEGETRVSLLEGLQGGTVTVPQFNGGLIAYWIGEEDEYAESLMTTADMTMTPKKLGVLVKITEEMKRFAGYGFESLLRRDMMRACAKKLDWTIAYGSGTNRMPRGITKTNGIRVYSAQSKKSGILGTDSLADTNIFQADWAGADLDFDGLDNMRLEVEEQDIDYDESAVKIGAPRYFARLRQLKVANYSGQSTQMPYLIGMPMLPDSRLAEIIGPFARSTQIKKQKPGASVGAPTTSANVKFADVFDGNLGSVVFGRWAGVEIDDDSGKGKGYTSDSTYMKLRLWGDVGMRRPQSIIVCPDAQILP